MTDFLSTMRRGVPVGHARGIARHVVDQGDWLLLIHELGKGAADLLALWSCSRHVHMLLRDRASGEFGVVTLECPERRYPSVSRLHLPALRFERTIRDLYGIDAHGANDVRRWLDHGRWGVRKPGGLPEAYGVITGDPYAFHASRGEATHQIPVGPVHAGIIEPGHFRFTANGEVVVRLEERLGYVHKGIEQLMPGASVTRGAQLAGRLSGDSTVAYAIAFSRAVELALDVEAPARAIWLRAVMAEIERIANHVGDIGAICNDAAFALMHAHTGALRERILRATKLCFGHRLMMDRVVPGGVACDLSTEGVSTLRGLLADIRKTLPRLMALFGDTVSLQDRTVGTGRVSADLVRQFAAGGFIGRASGRAFDSRRAPGYAPYTELTFADGASEEGDVDARVWVRFDEITASLDIIEQSLARLPQGPLRIDLPTAGEAREGAAFAEAFRGEVFAWVRLDAQGNVERCHLRDASWLQWPLLEMAIKGNIVADFPLCNKSFNCSYSGHDL